MQYNGKQLEGSMGQGVYITKAEIIGVKDSSGKIGADFQEKPSDLHIQLKLEVGRDFQPIMNIMGDFKKNQDGKIVGWGGAFKVAKVFTNLTGKEVDWPDNQIPAELLLSLKGKTIYRLSYIKGRKKDDQTKFQYADWSEIMPGDDEKNKLVLYDSWLASVKKGYPNNYHPELLKEQGDASFDTEALAGEHAVPAKKTDDVW